MNGTHTEFRSFWMGGYEGADHINERGDALDMASMTNHLECLQGDYRQACALGIKTVRESIGWRLSERTDGTFDFERVRQMAHAANASGVQVLWTLMHYGLPADLSLLDDSLVARFANFAGAMAETLAPLSAYAPVYTPINEISFLAWAAVETDMMGAIVSRRLERTAELPAIGYDIKRRVVRAALAGSEAIRKADPRAKIMPIEPAVHVVAPWHEEHRAEEARRMAGYQWQAIDLLTGRVEPELGGTLEAVDCIGINHYHNSQWELGSEGSSGRQLEWHLQDPRRIGLADLLQSTWERYGRPLVVGETGHFGEGRAAWLEDCAAELVKARRNGVPVLGACLYPLLDRPDWHDPSHWHPSGLWEHSPAADDGIAMPRVLNLPYARSLAAWRRQFDARQ